MSKFKGTVNMPINKFIVECLQCGEVFFISTGKELVNGMEFYNPNLHKCKQLNSKLKDVLKLGDVEEIADCTITGVCKVIGKIKSS